MKKGEIVFHCTRPPAVVWGLLSDLESAPTWAPSLLSVEKRTEGSVRVGTRYIQVLSMQGQTTSAEVEITAFEAPRLFAHEGAGGPATFSARFELEPHGEGTRVTHSYTLKLSGPARIMESMIGALVRKNAEESIENLRRLIENA